MNNKIPKEIKNRMDREFRQYWNTVRELKEIESEEIIPTRRYLYINRKIGYVRNAINLLKPFEKEVFYLIFKQGYDWTYCETTKNISKTTYYNIYNKAIKLLAEEWGEI